MMVRIQNILRSPQLFLQRVNPRLQGRFDAAGELRRQSGQFHFQLLLVRRRRVLLLVDEVAQRPNFHRQLFVPNLRFFRRLLMQTFFQSIHDRSNRSPRSSGAVLIRFSVATLLAIDRRANSGPAISARDQLRQFQSDLFGIQWQDIPLPQVLDSLFEFCDTQTQLYDLAVDVFVACPEQRNPCLD